MEVTREQTRSKRIFGRGFGRFITKNGILESKHEFYHGGKWSEYAVREIAPTNVGDYSNCVVADISPRWTLQLGLQFDFFPFSFTGV